jgi:hypothetical protein
MTYHMAVLADIVRIREGGGATSARKLHALPRIRLTLTALSWKLYRLFPGRPLVTKYRTAVKSVQQVTPVSTKSTFRVWAYCCFLQDTTYAVL